MHFFPLCALADGWRYNPLNESCSLRDAGDFEVAWVSPSRGPPTTKEARFVDPERSPK